MAIRAWTSRMPRMIETMLSLGMLTSAVENEGVRLCKLQVGAVGPTSFPASKSYHDPQK